MVVDSLEPSQEELEGDQKQLKQQSTSIDSGKATEELVNKNDSRILSTDFAAETRQQQKTTTGAAPDRLANDKLSRQTLETLAQETPNNNNNNNHGEDCSKANEAANVGAEKIQVATSGTRLQQQQRQTSPETNSTTNISQQSNNNRQQSSGVASGLNLNMTASQMRELIASRKKFDPKKAQMNIRQKYEIIQQM